MAELAETLRDLMGKKTPQQYDDGMEDNPYRAPLCTEAGFAAVKRSACYLSTPEHLRSFVGRFIYIYADKGELALTDHDLTFVGKDGLPLVIALKSIAEIRLGHYSRWAKPLRLDYLAVRCGNEQVILLTPTTSWATPVWHTNKIVAEWKSVLETAVPKAVH